MDKPIIHVGLPNTGTTWLQQNFFPLIKNKKIISQENLSGWVSHPVEYRYMMAYGLKELYPNARIILGLRDKKDWIKSSYRHHIKRGGTESFEDWLKTFDKRLCNFEEYLRLLINLFGDIFVYHFEEFQKNKLKVLYSMCEFIGCEVPDYNDEIINKGWDKTLLLGLKWNRLNGKIRFIISKLEGEKI